MQNIKKYAIVIIFLHLVNMFVAKCCIFYHNKNPSVTSRFIVYLQIAIFPSDISRFFNKNNEINDYELDY